MKNFLKTFIFFISIISFSNCSKDLNDGIPIDIEINDFVWKGMNAYYYWQSDVPNLADSRFSNQSEINNFTAGFSTPEDIFKAVRFQPDIVDRFSWIVDDYIALEKLFQGISLNSGMEFGNVFYKDGSENVFGYVRYVIPGSDAATKGILRGMIFNTIDGTQLTNNNYRSLLFGNSTSYTVGFADFNNGNPISNGNSILLSKTELQENPLAVSKVINDGGKKIGYLMYNHTS